MTELEELQEQKKEIEQRIKELRHADKNVKCGRAKLAFMHYPGVALDHYYIGIECIPVNKCDRTRSAHIIQGLTREDAAGQIPEVIKDLQGLYDKLKGESK
jgi:hypothetical protein